LKHMGYGVHVGIQRDMALDEKQIADDIMRVNKGRAHISLSAAARYLGVKDETAKELLIDVPRRVIGKRYRINARDLARYINSRTTFIT
jgi:hypothetical protein